MPNDTLEIRWISPELKLENALDLLRRVAGCEPSAESTRTDQYLRLPCTDTMSVKVREGRLEHKWLTGTQPAGLPKEFPGSRFGRWRKLALSYASDSSQTDHCDWIAVRKSRWQSYWTVQNTQPRALTEPGSRSTRCDVEVSEIQVGVPIANGAENTEGVRACSLCFESEGPECEGLLSAVVDKHIEAGLAQTLAGSSCMDYPAWLRRILASTPSVD